MVSPDRTMQIKIQGINSFIEKMGEKSKLRLVINKKGWSIKEINIIRGKEKNLRG